MAEGNITVNVSKNQWVDSLKKASEQYKEKAREVDTLLKNICAVYGHDDRDDGHDSHYSYVKCYCCGKVEKA